MRKPIQITTTVITRREDGEVWDVSFLTALCDDGTIWESKDSGPWYQLDAIPQPGFE